jgi:hypothetical protein
LNAANVVAGESMFDVYVNNRNGLLIVVKGSPVPEKVSGSWRKKRSVRCVSDHILADIRATGFHLRNLALRRKAAVAPSISALYRESTPLSRCTLLAPSHQSPRGGARRSR